MTAAKAAVKVGTPGGGDYGRRRGTILKPPPEVLGDSGCRELLADRRQKVTRVVIPTVFY